MIQKMIVSCAALLLSACAAPPPVPVVESPVDLAMLKSKESNALKLREMRVSNDPEQAIRQDPQGNVTIVRSDDAANLLPIIASKTSKKFIVRGSPVLPLPIALDVSGASVQQVLQSVAEQISSRADIVLEDGAIVLEYRVKTK